MKPVRDIAILVTFVLCWGNTASAQGDGAREAIRIEAEIITGLEAGASADPGISGARAGGGPRGGTAAGQLPQGSQPNSTRQVASRLIDSGNQGSLSLADTAMVAALAAGSRDRQQQLDALISVTVVDAEGNVVSTSMPAGSVPLDIFGSEVGNRPVRQNSAGMVIESLIGGDIMRRSGRTYFFVQVCSCSL